MSHPHYTRASSYTHQQSPSSPHTKAPSNACTQPTTNHRNAHHTSSPPHARIPHIQPTISSPPSHTLTPPHNAVVSPHLHIHPSTAPRHTIHPRPSSRPCTFLPPITYLLPRPPPHRPVVRDTKTCHTSQPNIMIPHHKQPTLMSLSLSHHHAPRTPHSQQRRHDSTNPPHFRPIP